MPRHPGMIVQKYAKMWPREVFDVKSGNKYDLDVKTLLTQPGVYVLYRDDQPYYVGKASKSVFRRLRRHAVNPKDAYYNFWNFFSVFAVADTSHVSEVEGILIAAVPTDNRAVPRITKIPLPARIASLLRAQRSIRSSEMVDEAKSLNTASHRTAHPRRVRRS